jgi:hypothetical protein
VLTSKRRSRPGQVTKSTINKRALELICHSYYHNCIRLVVCKFGEGVQLQLLQLGFWLLVGLSLGYGLDFLLGLWLFLLGALPLEKGALPWLAIVLLLELFCLSRLRCSGVAFVPMVG